MILQPPTKQDYDFNEMIRLDLKNEGFSADEIGILTDLDSAKGAKGILDLWKKNRQAPPEIENLKSEFGYQANPSGLQL